MAQKAGLLAFFARFFVCFYIFLQFYASAFFKKIISVSVFLSQGYHKIKYQCIRHTFKKA